MNESYPKPSRQTIDDLNPASATTEALIAIIRSHREGEDYPTPETLLANLPIVLRALCDHLLSGKATALDIAYRLASMIDAIEDCPAPPASTQRLH